MGILRRRREARAQAESDARYRAACDVAWELRRRLGFGEPIPPLAPSIALAAGEQQLTAPIRARAYQWKAATEPPAYPGRATVTAWTTGQALAARIQLDRRDRQWEAEAREALAEYWAPLDDELTVVATSHRLVMWAATPRQYDLWWPQIRSVELYKGLVSDLVVHAGPYAWWVISDDLPPVSTLALWYVHHELADVPLPAAARQQIAENEDKAAALMAAVAKMERELAEAPRSVDSGQ